MMHLQCLIGEEHTEGHGFTSNHNINEVYLPEVGAEEGKLLHGHLDWCLILSVNTLTIKSRQLLNPWTKMTAS